jgi:hypothetical protein
MGGDIHMSILDRQTHKDLETWRKLLGKAITAIEIVERETSQKQSIRLGGGTVLSALWGHRYSQDVDLFTRDPQIIAYLRPWLNDEIAAVLGNDYVDGGNAIKFRVGGGAIDIVASSDILTDSSPTIEEYRGRMIEIEDPVEILAKKLYHRGDRGTVRDYVDLVRGMQEIPDLAKRLSKPLGNKIRGATEVLRQIPNDRFESELAKVRFIGPPPEARQLKSEAIAALEKIGGPFDDNDGQKRAAWQAMQGRGPGY